MMQNVGLKLIRRVDAKKDEGKSLIEPEIRI